MFLAVVKYCVLSLTPPSCELALTVWKERVTIKVNQYKFCFYYCLHFVTFSQATFIAKNDGDRDHNHARAGPDVLHKELLEHDIPKALTEKQRHLIANGLVSTIQVVQFNLEK